MERTARADELTEDELLAWLRSLNAVRLVLGTRLGVTEDSPGRFRGDDEARSLRLYGYLTWLEAAAVEALSTDLGILPSPACWLESRLYQGSPCGCAASIVPGGLLVQIHVLALRGNDVLARASGEIGRLCPWCRLLA